MKMRDVARRAGVSPATVSRVLNGVPTVGEEHRRRVLRAIEELGYRPNRLASNLRRQKAEMIGVVVSDIENPHFTGMVRAVEDAAYRKGYRVLLCNTDETPQKQRSYLEVLAAERVLGVILSPSDPEDEEIGELLDLGIPVVAFDRTVADPRADAVVVDNVGGVRAATRRLVAAGHERIGFVGGSEGIETGSGRLAGYREAMLEAGLEPRVAHGGFRIEGGWEATRRLLSEGLTALVVGNNLMTIGALRALREMGLRVPRDLALVAVDDPFWAELVEPPLTTLAQPVREMAGCAMRMMLERISGERSEPRREVFEFELRVRGSCGTA
ncbi:transcriptional regulator, LacI family [Rubrobacter xylanophilus DSM 9941]|uniref:Transcriptional regulator, LacI family n=1 Tax=Rubrobacter xylanophilus (strain DSM 9941 / JCM 11954 / NBRC 16129 / PRD-1) TaxID=266117 RepID=Q1AXS9_RUBXD|nr:LacI family DNA-binding transcriptional regulator [Rubrobacter xylanophilus]ABG03799.1 transcriptional regulator, LacI family [Rubrobacter xylanophilus DSM 9941]